MSSSYDFKKIPHAPFGRGETPALAWYLIEPVDRNEFDQPVDAETGKPKVERVMEIYDAKTARTLAEQFSLSAWMDIGIPVNKDHLHISGGSTESYGWIKALHATDEGLWACIEWTDEGLGLINAGKYAFFSTEYPFSSYVRDGVDEESGLPIARPGRLTGLAITNYPANRRQTSMTRSAEAIPVRRRSSAAINPPHDINTMNGKKAKDTRSRSEDEFKEESDQETTRTDETKTKSEETTEDETKTNSEEKTEAETNCNSEDMEFWTSLLSKLGLDPEDTEIDKADILAAVEALSSENDSLRESVKTNRAKLGAASRLSRLGFQARREAKAPDQNPTHKPGEMTSAQKDMATHVDKRVAEARTRRENMGQHWRPEDYSAAVASAQNEWIRKNPGKLS